jgi:hypothetical protein
MGKYFASIALIVLIQVSVKTATASDASQKVFTSSGLVEVALIDESKKCEIRLSGKVILSWDCTFSYAPHVLGPYKGVQPFNDVLVLQEAPQGNACNGGPIRVLGFAKGKEVKAFKTIDFCGGEDPVLKQEGNELKILFPGGPPNRGTGAIPDELWILKEGSISKGVLTRK